MSEVISNEPTTSHPNSKHPASIPGSEPAVEVFAIYGVEPEIQAYAMARYSRSSLSMKEALKEITVQKAEKFLNTFYFQYGHRSIADLAHIALAIEKLSILAAIVVADEQRWDGQERSTRYQDFRKSGYHTPSFGNEGAGSALFHPDALLRNHRVLVHNLRNSFAAYVQISRSITPRPAEMKPDAYERTLRARAFDVSRYLLRLRDQHFPGRDRQRPHAGKPGCPPALAAAQGSPRSGSAAETSRSFPRLQRQRRIAARASGRDSRRIARNRRSRGTRTPARGSGCAHAGQVRRSESLRNRDAPRTASGRR